MAVLRGLEDAITAGAQAPLIATTTTAVALYILNSKRAYVADMEARHGFAVTVLGSDRIHGANFTIERGTPSALPLRRPERAAVNMDWGFEGEEDEEAPSPAGDLIEDVGDADDVEESSNRFDRQPSREGSDEEGGRGRKRRRRRRGGRRGERGDENPNREFAGPASAHDDEEGDEPAQNGFDDGNEAEASSSSDEGDAQDSPRAEGEENGSNGERGRRRRRRGRRGGRRGRGDREGGEVRTSGDSEPDDDNGTSQEDANGAGIDDVASGAPQVAAPGFEPQPDVDLPLAPFELTNEDVPQSRTDTRRQRPRSERGDRSDRGDRERKRPERIWDVAPANLDEPAPEHKSPAAGDNPAPSAPQPEERPVTQPEAAPAAEQRHNDIRSRRHEQGSSEPRIERVVVRTDQNGDASPETPAAPQRKGWWQRRFGGE